MHSKPVFLDLFAGCGGLSLGFTNAGFTCAGAIEADRWAADTFSANHSAPVFCDKIESFSDDFFKSEFEGKVDVVAGGPPCQGFSVSGDRQFGKYKPENRLIFEFIRAVSLIRPKMFLLENVRGFVTASVEGRRQALSVLLEDLTQLGYHVYHTIIQAADFGIPQTRTRVFVLGSAAPLKAPFPTVTHGLMGMPEHLGVWDAISDLPEIEAREGTDERQEYTMEPKNEFQASMRDATSGVYNHQAMKHTDRLVERFKSLPPGGKGYDIGRQKKSASTVTVYKSNNQRLIHDKPSLCITANFQSTYIHPFRHRNLTAREAARIMTFPDHFRFKGKRTLMSSKLLCAEGREGENFLSQYNQIGNAVPPLLAQRISEHIKLNLENPQ